MTSFQGLDANDAREFNELWLPAWTGNRPEHLVSFYSEDAFYADPGNWPGVRGRRALLEYFTRLLARFPDWTWSHRGSQPLKDGFLNGCTRRSRSPAGSSNSTACRACSCAAG